MMCKIVSFNMAILAVPNPVHFSAARCSAHRCTVIPRLTQIIRSGITFVSRNELLEWPDRSCLLLYVSVRIHYNIRQPNPYSLAGSEKQRKKSSLAEKFFSRVTRQPRYHCNGKWTVSIYHVVFAYMKYSTSLSQTLSLQGKLKGALLFLSPLCKLQQVSVAWLTCLQICVMKV